MDIGYSYLGCSGYWFHEHGLSDFQFCLDVKKMHVFYYYNVKITSRFRAVKFFVRHLDVLISRGMTVMHEFYNWCSSFHPFSSQ